MKINFSPIQGYTDKIYRHVHKEFFGGIDTYYCPFIRLQPDGSIRNKDVNEISNVSPYFIPQILAYPDVVKMKKLISTVVQHGHSAIDINMGCPFPMISGKRCGCGILEDHTAVADILNIIESYKNIDFSLKMRLGLKENSDTYKLMDLINGSSVKSVCIHARTGSQQYKGEPDVTSFKLIYDVCSKPLIYNGDINDVSSANSILSSFPRLSGIAIGRGLLANPGLANEIKAGIEGTLIQKTSLNVLYDFHTELCKEYSAVLCGESQILLKLKTLWDYFLPMADSKLLKAMKKSKDLSTYMRVSKEIFDRLK